MKVCLFAVLLAVTVATSVAAEVVTEAKTVDVAAVTDVPETKDDAETTVETEGEEESETEAKEEEKEEEGDSNESSSEENEEENEEEESSTKASEEVTTVAEVTDAPVVYTTEAYIKPSYVIPTTATYSKAKYLQVPGPAYKPVITTEATKISKTEISVPVAVETPKFESKYVKPIIAAVLETATKNEPIVVEKAAPVLVGTVRKSGWVRAPGYKLGYARSESSDSVAPISKRSNTSPAKTLSSRQTHSQWFFKPNSAIPASN